MRYIIACAALIFALSAPQTQAAGPYDGIWALLHGNAFFAYVTINENNGTIIAVVLDPNVFVWAALRGPRSGAAFDIASIEGLPPGITVRFGGAFTSATTFHATVLECRIDVEEYGCALPPGTTLTANKIW